MNTRKTASGSPFGGLRDEAANPPYKIDPPYRAHTTGYEGDRVWKTGLVEQVDVATGKIKRSHHAHPIEEAAETIKRLNEEVRPHYDEMLILRYCAMNEYQFPFEWVDPPGTQRDYATILTKISREYDQRL